MLYSFLISTVSLVIYHRAFSEGPEPPATEIHDWTLSKTMYCIFKNIFKRQLILNSSPPRRGRMGFVTQWTRKFISPTADIKSYHKPNLLQHTSTTYFSYFGQWASDGQISWESLADIQNTTQRTGKMQELRKFTLFWILISKGRRVFESLSEQSTYSSIISQNI